MKKLLVCDVEGTIFQAKYKIDGTDYASTMWQPLARCLGPDAIREEKESHRKWENKEYNNYTEWVKETFNIHKKHRLHVDNFNKLVNDAEYIDGVVEFFDRIDRSKYIPVLVSGGFEELIFRAQKELKINHGAGACKYIFCDKTGVLLDCILTPCDFSGKYNYVKTIFDVYSLDPGTDWVFIGDGKNDIDIAKRSPLSFGINPHPELAKEVTYNVGNFHEIFDLLSKCEDIIYIGKEAFIEHGDELDKDIRDVEYFELIKERNVAIMQRDLSAAAEKIAHENLNKVESLYNQEIIKRRNIEQALEVLDEKLKSIDNGYAKKIKRIKEINSELETSTEKEKIALLEEIERLSKESLREKTQRIAILNEREEQKQLLDYFQSYCEEKENTIDVLKNRIVQLEQECATNDDLTKKLCDKASKEYKIKHEMCRRMFKNINFSNDAIEALYTNGSTQKLTSLLNALNTKNIPNVEYEKWHGENNAIEYHFSHSGRVIAIYEDNKNPFIKKIYFNHEHCKG